MKRSIRPPRVESEWLRNFREQNPVAQMRDTVDIERAGAIRAMINDNFNSQVDMLELQAKNWFVPVFVYGNEQRNFSDNFHLGATAMYIGSGFTNDKTFLMQKCLDFNTPIVIQAQQQENVVLNRVFGELWLVEPEAIFLLDDCFERGIFHRRFRKDIIHKDPTDTEKKWFKTNAFMYTGIFDMFKERIKSGRMPPVEPHVDHESNYVMCRWMFSDDTPNRIRKEAAKEAALKFQHQHDPRAL